MVSPESGAGNTESYEGGSAEDEARGLFSVGDLVLVLGCSVTAVSLLCNCEIFFSCVDSVLLEHD